MVLPNRQTKTTDFVKKTYDDYFGVKLGDQDKPFVPLVCCKTCMENLRDWRNRNSFSSISVGSSVQMKETHDNMDDLLSAVYYLDHKKLICRHLKMFGLFSVSLGQPGWRLTLCQTKVVVKKRAKT